jgi:cyclomaltodextrinase / maltogenic alpha-amylase / neopullulanase
VSNIRLGRYRHFKGRQYEVIGVARDSETLQEKVVYRALYGARELWLRSPEMFSEVVQREGAAVPRFEFIGEMD